MTLAEYYEYAKKDRQESERFMKAVLAAMEDGKSVKLLREDDTPGLAFVIDAVKHEAPAPLASLVRRSMEDEIQRHMWSALLALWDRELSHQLAMEEGRP
jgi:hypothetical protein